jgi:hypothetical protein
MERNTKILLGLGAVALGYYLYTKNKAKSVVQASSEEPKTPQRPYMPQPNPLPKKTIIFSKGQEIIGIRDRNVKCAIGGGVCPILTTRSGQCDPIPMGRKKQNLDFITIPQGYLRMKKRPMSVNDIKNTPKGEYMVQITENPCQTYILTKDLYEEDFKATLHN